MANAKIGALRVDLGMNTAVFEKGVDLAQRKLNRFAGNAKKIGAQMGDIGKKMSMSLTAPIVAAGAAFGKLAHDMAREAKEMKTAAQVAGEGFEDFQRQAHAAKTVGIEFDKLGDIFKDVRDRVGDFAATGGGPMADFFENIAPKVGITQEAFKGLSGKDGLQLYYDSLVKAGASQEEIVFYMEAMASDATNLIPLLKDSGKAMAELGENAAIIDESDAEAMKRYTDAQIKMEAAIRKLTIALVDSGLLDVITGLIEKFAAFTANLAETNPTLLKVGAAFAVVLAALGPVLVGLGSLVSIVGAVVSAFGPFISVLTIAFRAGGLLTAAKAAVSGLGAALGLLPNLLKAVGIAIRFMLGPIGLAITAIGAVYYAWKNWDTIEPIIRNLYLGVKKWIVDKLGAIWDWLKGKLADVKGYFYDVYDAVVGNSYIPDMVDEIGQHMSRLDALMVDPARQATQSTGEAFRSLAGRVQGIMERLFPQFARLRRMNEDLSDIDALEKAGELDQGMAERLRFGVRQEARGATGKLPLSFQQGPLATTEGVKKSIKEIARSVGLAADKTQTQTVRIAKSFKDMAQETMNSLKGLADSIKNGGFLDILGSAVDMILQLGSAGLFGSKFQASLNSDFGGARAMGGPVSMGKSYLVGENGPELFSPGSSGRITPNHALGGGQVVHVSPSPYFDVRVEQVSGGVVAAAAPSLVRAGGQAGMAQMQRMSDRRMG